MCRTFRSSFLVAIISLALALSGNMLFAQSGAPTSLEQALNSQYPKGTVLNLLATGVTGTGLCGISAQSTYKVVDGKLHAAGFGQNMLLAAAKCAIQPIASGTQVHLTATKVNPKANRVVFNVLQGECVVADCSRAVEGFISAEVDFEFPKGFMDTAQFAQVQDAIGHVFSIASTPNAPAQEVQVAAPVSEPAPLAEEKSIDSGARSGTVSDQARPVLERAIQFFGGVDNIRALRNDEGRAQTTQISQGNVVQIQSHWISVYPNIQWQEYQASVGQKSMSGVSFFDGTIGWHIRNGKLTDMDEVQKTGATRAIFTQPKNLLALSGGPTVNYEGKSGADDVLLFRQGELSCRLHIDSMGQVVKYAYRDKTDEIDVIFSDYRDVGGVKMAYRNSMTKNGQTWIDSQVIQAEANTNPSLEKLAQKPGGPLLSASYLASIAPLQYPSLYVSAQTPADRLQLNADYTFQLQEGGQPYHGTFAIRGNTLLLNINESNIQTPLTRQGHDLADSNGQTWSYREPSLNLIVQKNN